MPSPSDGGRRLGGLLLYDEKMPQILPLGRRKRTEEQTPDDNLSSKSKMYVDDHRPPTRPQGVKNSLRNMTFLVKRKIVKLQQKIEKIYIISIYEPKKDFSHYYNTKGTKNDIFPDMIFLP